TGKPGMSMYETAIASRASSANAPRPEPSTMASGGRESRPRALSAAIAASGFGLISPQPSRETAPLSFSNRQMLRPKAFRQKLAQGESPAHAFLPRDMDRG